MRHRRARRPARARRGVLLAGVSASGPGPVAGRGRAGAQPARAGRGDPVTGGSAALSTLTRAVPVLDSDTVVFEHVLAGVGLSGPAARLAGMLQAGFLAEAGWDPAERVV